MSALPSKFSALFPHPKNWRACLILFILIVASLLRLVVWLQNRSFFIDECNLVRNFVEKPYADFFKSLSYEQFSPPLFSVLEKVLLTLFGVREWVARGLPLLAGIGSLWLFRRVAGRWLAPGALQLALIFLGFGLPFLRYSTEAKQYSTDLFTALLLVWLALPKGSFLKKQIWQTGVAGVVAVWLSMPSVFVLATVGLYFLALIFKEKQGHLLPGVIAMGTAWLLSFAAYFFLVLRHDIGTDYLQRDHIFLQFSPFTFAGWQQLWERLMGIRTTAVGFTVVATLAFIIGLAASIPALLARRNWDWLLLALPIFLCLIASALHLYSLMERLTLFFIPFVLMLLGVGWQSVGERFGRVAGTLMTVIVLVAAAGYVKPQYFFQPLRVSEVRDGMRYVQQHRALGDVVYGHFSATAQITFYQQVATNPIDLGQYRQGGFAPDQELPRLSQTEPMARLWIIDNVQERLPYADWLGSPRRLLERRDFAGGSVSLYSAKQ